MILDCSMNKSWIMYFKKNVPDFQFGSFGIPIQHRIIITIGKHIISQQALAGGDVDISIEEAACCGIIISALQVIQPGISRKEIPLRHFLSRG